VTASASTASSTSAASTARAPQKIWLDGELVSREDAKVSVYDHGLLYGDGCFEGIRVYGGRVFKLRSHLERLYRSADLIRLAPAYPLAALANAVRETVAANGLKDAYIRILLTRGVGTLGLHPFRCPKPGTVVIVDAISLYPEELYERGMKVIVAKRPRIPVQCLDPAIKSLNYLNNILAKIEAIDADVLEAIMLNTEGFVSECTGDNIFAVKGGRISTPPEDAGILHGITRAYVMHELAPALGMRVEQRPMRLEDLYTADEVFLTGTAAEIIGVSAIGDHTIGSGAVGPITKQLEAEFRKRVGKDAPED
jgi:branched-chain amino acid aminotransferase